MSGAEVSAPDTRPHVPAGGAGAHSRPEVLQSKALVLNRSYLPIHITSVRRACVLLYQNVARAVDARYQTFDFPAWCQRGWQTGDETLGLVGRSIAVPRVILLVGFDRVPRRYVRFTRYNVYARDGNTCQYCARHLPRHELNLDHVIPRSQGGQSTWENIVCSCHSCNRRKGGRTPEQSGIRLLRRPTRPAWTPFLTHAGGVRYREWGAFLSVAGPASAPVNGSSATSASTIACG
jgi:5-methylcytosine-specific restriction endonuclease McrA